MKTILVTGATGFLGGAVTINLLKKSHENRLLLLVRGNSPAEGLDRLLANLRKFGINKDELSSLTTENILIGDLAEPERFTDDLRLNEVTHVINCAAVASFGSNPYIWKVNVEGTFKLASRMNQVSGLQRFIQVGTAMSCAPEANTVVTERELNTVREEHIVEYTWSKASVEKMICEKLPSLPLVIARPSIIVGHSKYGCNPSPSIFWVFRMALTLGKFMCELNDRIDVVPVDYCADALELLLTAEHVEKEVFHISAGLNSYVTFAEIDEAMAKATGNNSVAQTYQKINYRELAESKKDFSTLFGPCNERIVLRAMNLYGQFSKLNVVFSNEKLLTLGMPPSLKFTDYLEYCVASTKGLSIAQMMEVDFK